MFKKFIKIIQQLSIQPGESFFDNCASIGGQVNRTSKIQPQTTMLKRSRFETTQSQIMQRSEDLINAASNRYRITVQVANRAKRRRYEDFENNEDSIIKPVLRAIIEMSDELTQPEIIGELPSDWL